jgi:uncharacterized protein YybS (DUF2232 family)
MMLGAKRVFVILVLAGVAYDVLLGTPFWVRIQYGLPVSRALRLLTLPVMFLIVYLTLVCLTKPGARVG